MFNEFYDALYERLAKFLSELLMKEPEPVKRLSGPLQEIQKVLSELREKVLSRTFSSKSIEISFFKTIKPKFYALRIYQLELYGLDMNRPAAVKDALLAYYREELRQVERFFKQHAFLYQYFKSGFTEMDHLYFRRAVEVPVVLVPEMPDLGPEYSTVMDYLFSKFMAYELLQAEIIKRIGGLDGTLVVTDRPPVKPVPALKWTGSHVNLVELIYGLYYTLQFNNGDADVTEIVALMEATFSIKLRDAHHSFVEIRRRKVDSPARFLEQMAAAIRQRVDDDLDYKPHLKQALKNQTNPRTSH
jgi:hypothetical protein